MEVKTKPSDDTLRHWRDLAESLRVAATLQADAMDDLAESLRTKCEQSAIAALSDELVQRTAVIVALSIDIKAALNRYERASASIDAAADAAALRQTN
jgi:hypothetical protein